MGMMTQLSLARAPVYLDDVKVGDRLSGGRHEMTQDRIISFAEEFDPQPFHIDPEAAAKSLFGGLAASGWHTAAATMRMLVDVFPAAGGLIGMGGEVHWPAPTRPGDTLSIEVEIVEVTPSRSKPDRGTVVTRTETKNQHGTVVQVTQTRIIMPRRVG
jgi:acyl dehydratase